MANEHIRVSYRNLNSKPSAQQEEAEHLDSVLYGVSVQSTTIYNALSMPNFIWSSQASEDHQYYAYFVDD